MTKNGEVTAGFEWGWDSKRGDHTFNSKQEAGRNEIRLGVLIACLPLTRFHFLTSSNFPKRYFQLRKMFN